MCCTRGATVGVNAVKFSSSELRLSAPSSCGIFDGENKCSDHGTVLLHGGEGRRIVLLWALVVSPGAAELTPCVPGVGIPFPGDFLLWSLL